MAHGSDKAGGRERTGSCSRLGTATSAPGATSSEERTWAAPSRSPFRAACPAWRLPRAGRPSTIRSWLFEPAFVGTRVLARVEGDRVGLRSSSEDLAGRLPGIVKALAVVRAETAVFDGIVVALDEHGKPSEAALAAELESGGSKAVLYLFDVLYAEEWDLRKLALRERKAVLRALLPESGKLFLVDAVAERGRGAGAGGGGIRAACHRGQKVGQPVTVPGAFEDWLLIPAATGQSKPDSAPRPARRREGGEPCLRGNTSAKGVLAGSGLHEGRPGELLRQGGRLDPPVPRRTDRCTSTGGPTASAGNRSTRSSFPRTSSTRWRRSTWRATGKSRLLRDVQRPKDATDAHQHGQHRPAPLDVAQGQPGFSRLGVHRPGSQGRALFQRDQAGPGDRASSCAASASSPT